MMLFGGEDRSKPEFYSLNGTPLPPCLMGLKAPLPRHSSGDTLRNPFLIRDPGTSVFILFPCGSPVQIVDCLFHNLSSACLAGTAIDVLPK